MQTLQQCSLAPRHFFLAAECPCVFTGFIFLTTNKERRQVGNEARHSNSSYFARYSWSVTNGERQPYHSIIIACAIGDVRTAPRDALANLHIGIRFNESGGCIAVIITGFRNGIDDFDIAANNTAINADSALLAIGEPAFLFRSVTEAASLDVPAILLLDIPEQTRL